MKDKLLWSLLPFFLPLGIVLAWVYVSGHGILPALLLPSPGAVMSTFWGQLTAGTLKTDIFVSLRRILSGYTLAAAAGISLGVIMGMSRLADGSSPSPLRRSGRFRCWRGCPC